ncbi:MAG: polysaccharide biosynthesis C-terminal domain-containing protein [Pseudomonadota bacterium]
MSETGPNKSGGILGSFGRLLSAQGVEALLSTLFFLYLAWRDAASYGAVMYALAAGTLVNKVVQFGLYYPLVSDLGGAAPDFRPVIINRVNVIKLILLGPTMITVLGYAFYSDMSFQVAGVLFLVSLGFGFEAIAETFFADFRVQRRQDAEAKIKIISSTASYGFGFLTALAHLDPVFLGLFKLIGGLSRLVLSAWGYLRPSVIGLLKGLEWTAVWSVFKAAGVFACIEILGIIYNKTNIFFLESVAGVQGVAYYSATWNLVDPISVLASQQLLGWVIFPLLAGLWWKDQDRAARLIRANALWLLVIAFPIMFILHSEAAFMIGLIYPKEYHDAVWMQQYLVWTILLSFENNLFNYVIMVSGGARVLLAFAVATTLLNLGFNYALVGPFGLAGGCWVIILTKLVMGVFVFCYCQLKFGFFNFRDALFPLLAGGVLVGGFLALRPLITIHPAVAISLAAYLVIIWKLGPRFLGGALKAKESV